MERITGDGFFSYRREVGEKRGSRAAGRSAPARSFVDRLAQGSRGVTEAETLPELTDEQAAELLDQVFESGDRLKRHGDGASLRAYREAVRRFVSAVVRGGYEVEEHTSGATVAKRKRYALLKVIDRKLEQLAAGMLASQRGQLDLLARVDEINGLIVDLTR